MLLGLNKPGFRSEGFVMRLVLGAGGPAGFFTLITSVCGWAEHGGRSRCAKAR